MRLAEALNIESSSTPAVSHGAADVLLEDGKSHEAAVVHRLSTPLHEALESTNRSNEFVGPGSLRRQAASGGS